MVSGVAVTVFSYLPMDGAGQSAVYTIVNTTFYAAIIYGNILFLYPVFYQKEKYVWYVLLVIIFLVATGVSGVIQPCLFIIPFLQKHQSISVKKPSLIMFRAECSFSL